MFSPTSTFQWLRNDRKPKYMAPQFRAPFQKYTYPSPVLISERNNSSLYNLLIPSFLSISPIPPFILSSSPSQAALASSIEEVNAKSQNNSGKNCFFDITIQFEFPGPIEPAGRIIFKLHDDITPRTARNFRELCTGQHGFGYEGTPFHRIFPTMLQGGSLPSGDEQGQRSIYGGLFEDENFILKHTKPGQLFMVNHGRDRNGSQFVISTAALPHLDGKNVVFGEVVEGLNLVQRIEKLGSFDGLPRAEVVIVKSGVVE